MKGPPLCFCATGTRTQKQFETSPAAWERPPPRRVNTPPNSWGGFVAAATGLLYT